MRTPEYKIRVAEPIITREDIEAVVKALEETRLSSGPYSVRFEEDFASYVDVKHAVSVNSGTAALHIIVKSLGVGPNDEMITTPFTFAATSNVAILLGARPVFVDVEDETYNLDPNQLEKAITKKTKVIMPIHYGGQVCEMNEINKIASECNVAVAEDAAPAAGATYKGKMAGALGRMAAFSFYPDKNITTGEGGMITTNEPELAEISKIYRNHGATARYYHEHIGWNYRMSDILAALGISQLRRLESVIREKNKLAKRYNDLLEGVDGVHPPIKRSYNRHTYMLYSIRTDTGEQRNSVKDLLLKNGIETRINFPTVHLQPMYRTLYGYKPGTFPVAERLADTILGLPIYLGLTEEQQDLVVNIIKKALK